MELHFLPAAEKYFNSRSADEAVIADLIVLCQEVSDTVPPTIHPAVQSLKGELKGIFYCRYYKRNQSVRLCFVAGKGMVVLVMILPNKRRQKLSTGETQQLKNARSNGKKYIEENSNIQKSKKK